MTAAEMSELVKQNLKIEDGTRDPDISDVIFSICDFCNLDPGCIPEILEPVVRKKVKGIMDYEEANGSGYQQDIASIKEGDGSITYVTDGANSREDIYGLCLILMNECMMR